MSAQPKPKRTHPWRAYDPAPRGLASASERHHPALPGRWWREAKRLQRGGLAR